MSSLTKVSDQRPDNAWGHGLATLNEAAEVLDVWFFETHLGGAPTEIPANLIAAQSTDPLRKISTRAISATSELTAKVANAADAYLRLHLLSQLKVQPNTINLDGLFAALPNNLWTSAGPMSPTELSDPQLMLAIRRAGIKFYGLDKFPQLLDYVVPERVRIADGARVRLGAHLAPGTTVMHEGFVNFNAGTLGAAMIEGRVSQGVIVDDGADIGGGASTMGTLSGGGSVLVRVGKRALLGANAGIGISLGDDSVVESGLYLTAGTKVLYRPHPIRVDSSSADSTRIIKAIELSGVPGLIFRRNSINGQVEAVPRKLAGAALNSDLHA